MAAINPKKIKNHKLNIGASELAEVAGMHCYKRTARDWWQTIIKIGLRSYTTRKVFTDVLNILLSYGVKPLADNPIFMDNLKVETDAVKLQESPIFQTYCQVISEVEKVKSESIIQEQAVTNVSNSNKEQLSAALANPAISLDLKIAISERLVDPSPILAQDIPLLEKCSIPVQDTVQTMDNYEKFQSVVTQVQEQYQAVSSEIYNFSTAANIDQRALGKSVEAAMVVTETLVENNDRAYSKEYSDTINLFAYIDGWENIPSEVQFDGYDKVPVEIKTRRNRLFDDIPEYELVQCAVILFTSERERMIWKQIYRNQNQVIICQEHKLRPVLDTAIGNLEEKLKSIKLKGKFSTSLIVEKMCSELSQEVAYEIAQYCENVRKEKRWD